MEVGDFLIHVFLQYFSLFIFQRLGTGPALGDQKHEPDNEDIKDQVVGKDGGDVAVPDGVVV